MITGVKSLSKGYNVIILFLFFIKLDFYWVRFYN
jgi:hypothetical protein